MSIEKKLDEEIFRVLKILEKRKIKPKIEIFKLISAIANMIVFIIMFLLMWYFIYIGMEKLTTESINSGTFFSLAALLLSILNFFIANATNSEHFKSISYLYEVNARDSVNELIYLLYDYKKFNCKIKIDEVEPFELKGKLYLKIRYH